MFSGNLRTLTWSVPYFTSQSFFLDIPLALTYRTKPTCNVEVTCLPQVHIQSMFYLVNALGAKLLNATLSCNITTKIPQICSVDFFFNVL